MAEHVKHLSKSELDLLERYIYEYQSEGDVDEALLKGASTMLKKVAARVPYEEDAIIAEIPKRRKALEAPEPEKKRRDKAGGSRKNKTSKQTMHPVKKILKAATKTAKRVLGMKKSKKTRKAKRTTRRH